jgi:hypothetical protein
MSKWKTKNRLGKKFYFRQLIDIPEINQSVILLSDPRDRMKRGGEHTYSSK